MDPQLFWRQDPQERTCPQLSLVSEEVFVSHERASSGRKKQLKNRVFEQDIFGTSGTQTSGYPGQKLYASGPALLF